MSRKNLLMPVGVRVAAAMLTAAFALFTSSVVQTLAAGSVSVSAAKSSAAVSEQVTVSVKTSDPEDASVPPQISISYDPALLQFDSCDVEYGGGEGGLVTINGTGGNITFTTLSAGTANISAEAIIDDDGNSPATGSASITVSSGASSEGGNAAGSNATLRALAIDPGHLSPVFSPDVTDYTITIDEGVTDITVSGGVTDASSQITAANGFKNLGDGENKAQITVTAADGSTLTYHFTIVRGDAAAAAAAEPETDTQEADTETAEADAALAETPQETAEPAGGQSTGFMAGAGIGGSSSKGDDMTILVGQNSYTIQPVIAEGLLPEGAAKTSITYAGQTIEAVSFESAGLTLVDARSNVDGSEKLFLYDAASDSFQGFVKLAASDGSFIIPTVMPSVLPDGFIADGADLGGVYVACGKLKDSTVEHRENVCLLYAIGSDGSQGYYLYDVLGGGFVHFLDYGKGGAGDGLGKRAIAIIVVLGIALFASLIVILVITLKKGEYGDGHYDDDDDDLFEQPARSTLSSRGQSSVKSKKSRRDPYEDDIYGDEYDEDEDIRLAAPKKKTTVKPSYDEGVTGAASASQPNPTVKKVRKTAPSAQSANADFSMDSDDSFDIDREIESMKEKAAAKSATARMANMDAALKNRSTTRTVLPQQEVQRPKAPAAQGARQIPQGSQQAQVRVKKTVRSEEITIDKPVRKPAPKPQRTVRADGSERPVVTKKVTEKGVTYTTGKIPITVVQSTKSDNPGAKASVPIFTLKDQQSQAQLSRQSLPSEPDTDFKFDFIDVDKTEE